MTKTAAILWLRAMNPLHIPRAMAEGQRSARAAVVGLGIALAVNLIQSFWVVSTPAFEALLAAQYQAMGLSPSEIAEQQALAQSMWPLLIVTMVMVTVAFFGVLALVQWRRMGRAIPLILLSFLFYRVFVGGGMRLLGHAPANDIDMPLWLQLIDAAAIAVTTVIYTASLQGAILLHRLKGQP